MFKSFRRILGMKNGNNSTNKSVSAKQTTAKSANASSSKKSKFIQFGCWNNLNKKDNGTEKGCLSEVMKHLSAYISTPVNHPDFLVISGDNYYPNKKLSDNGSKVKTIMLNNLRDGFDKLPDIETYMILGNHDLETGLNFNNGRQQPITKENDCKILQSQFDSIAGKKINYCLFDYKILNNTTILFMIDTTIYEKNDINDKGNPNEYLVCYKQFLEKKAISGLSSQEITIQSLRDYQKAQMLQLIKSNSKYTNVIIVGHHPIVKTRVKEQKDKDKKKDKSAVDPTQDKQDKKDKSAVKLIKKTDTDIPFFSDLLSSLPLNHNYYYLCSDLHLFQNGTIKINTESGTMMIKQIIVGTGGTELDDTIKSKFPDTGFPFTETYSNMSYTVDNDIAQCGFLECDYSKGLDFMICLIDNDNLTRSAVTFSSTSLTPTRSAAAEEKHTTVSGGNRTRNTKRNIRKHRKTYKRIRTTRN